MSKRQSKRVRRALKERQEDFDRIPIETRKAFNRPGSLNPRKSHGGTGAARKR